MMKISHIIVALVCGALFLTGCGVSEKDGAEKKEMLIYCGSAMVVPMKELAARFEKENNCKITINQGGSEDLYKSLEYSKVGELYLPGSESYRKNHLEDGLLTEYVEVGYNQVALVVQKGNPKQIPADISVLADSKYSVVIGNADSSSIGKQSKAILSKLGNYDDVVNNVMLIAADSRTMNKTIKDKSADVILNWGATAFFTENIDYMDRIPLPDSIAPKKILQINLLSFAKEAELARKFMKYAVSVEGQEVFHKYGFLDTVSTAGEIHLP
jgi:molybdate transport system substrate-binding protein